MFDNGITAVGESYLKEALFKMDLLKNYPIEWHMIGAIQHGKEKQIASNFAVVHSVTSLNVAEKLNKRACQIARIIPIFLELNVSGEEAKLGWSTERARDIMAIESDLDQILKYKNLMVNGLMTMAPYSENPEEARPYFKKLKEIQKDLSTKFPNAQLEDLSMGMSGDFEVAIEEGATVLRIGSALVGPR